MLVKCFIERGHDLEVRDRWGKLPSELAREKGFDSIALMLEILVRRKHLPPVPIHYLQDLYFPHNLAAAHQSTAMKASGTLILDTSTCREHNYINYLKKFRIVYYTHSSQMVIRLGKVKSQFLL